MNADLFAEYLICKQRGHTWDVGNNTVKSPKRKCKFCETIYWTEEREENIPKMPANVLIAAKELDKPKIDGEKS